MKSGLFEKVNFNDGGNVFVVSDVLGEYDERNGYISDSERTDVCTVNFLDALSGGKEGEVGKRENGKTGEYAEINDSE